MITKDNLKILLVQFRHAESMKNHERENVARSANVALPQVKVLSALSEPLDDDIYDCSDLIVLGGSGDYSIFADLACMPKLKSWMRRALKEDKPLLGSCLGAQFMAEFLGGEVVTDPNLEEIGSMAVSLTKEAESDPLFFDYPEDFMAQIGHQQTIIQIPQGAKLLAKTDKAIHAFAWPGLSLYAMQFHPELTKKGMVDRIIHHRDGYASDPVEYHRIINTATESPYTDNIIEKYIDRVALPRVNKN